MGKSFQNLLDKARSMHLDGTSTQKMRENLFSQGWDMNTVDRALWQLGFRDRQNIYFVKKMRKIAIVVVVVVGFAGLVAGTLYWERARMRTAEVAGTSDENAAPQTVDRSSRQEEAETILGGDPVSSSEARVSFSYPNDWILTTFPTEETPGAYQWQLEHADNISIKESLKQKYGISDETETASIANYALLNDPLARELVTVNILVNKAPYYEIETSLEEFRKELEEASGKIGYTASAFRKVSIDGIEGYAYTSKIELGQIFIETLEYIFLWDDQQLTISVLPAEPAKLAVEVNSILNSVSLRER